MNWLSGSSEVVLTAYHPSSKQARAANNARKDEQASPGRAGQHAVNQGNSPRAPPRAPFDRSGSQDSLDDLSLDDYFTEIENIKESSNSNQEDKEDVVFKEPDEGELEEEWLKEAGLSNLFAECPGDSQDSIVLLSTLTRTQSEAVRKRLDTVSQTMRKKNKPHPVPDVREIFKLEINSKEKDVGENGLPSAGAHGNNREKLNETPNDKTLIAGVYERTSSVEGVAFSETDINLEVSFAEQAANAKEFSKGKQQKDADDEARLPSFRVQKDKTGTTKIGDLAPQDMKKVYTIALIELTALYDVLGTDLKQQKAIKVKSRDAGIFGVPLSLLLEQDQRKLPATRVPLIFQKLISHIEEGLTTEGILRVPGAATRVKNLCQELEAKFYEGSFNWNSVKQHDAASLLKFFIRELPQPLLTVEYLKQFQFVQSLSSRKQQLQALNLLVLLLPDVNRDTLKALLEFLQKVVDQRQENKMTLKNVAVVMAPNLFSFHGFRIKANEQSEIDMAAGTASVMFLMIKYQALLWTIPNFIVSQVRKLNIENQKKQSKEKAMKKLLKKMAYDREKHEKSDKNLEAEVPQGVIRVQAPHFLKVSMAVQLTEDLKASDILARFLSQKSDISPNLRTDEVCLYEIGGNIVERSLEEDTYMKDLFQLNPNAEWVIKPKPGT